MAHCTAQLTSAEFKSIALILSINASFDRELETGRTDPRDFKLPTPPDFFPEVPLMSSPPPRR